MTQHDFHTDSYKSAFEAEVTAVVDGNGVVLSRTCFYPGGGGQPHDIGSLKWGEEEVAVERVSPSPHGVIHWLEARAPSVGTQVHGSIDWARRYALMRTHTALHILCGLIWRDHERLSTGCDMQPGAAHIDFELDSVTPELLAELETCANQDIVARRPVVVSTMERAEAEKIPGLIKTKVNLLPKHLTQLRLVEIVGLDLQADGGTHVANTSEVGGIRITRYKSKGRQNKRIYIELTEAN